MTKTKIKRSRGRPSETTGADQEVLLRTALGLFAKNGFEGTNIKSIAREGEVAGSLLYYHFENKEGVWKAAMRLLGEELRTEILTAQQLSGDLDSIQFVKSWMRRFVFFSAKNPEFHRIISHEMAHASSRADWILSEILGPLQERFKAQVRQLQKVGIMKQLPLANITSIVIGAANIFFTQAYQMKKLHNVNVFDKEEVNKHAETVIELLFHGIFLSK